MGQWSRPRPFGARDRHQNRWRHPERKAWRGEGQFVLGVLSHPHLQNTEGVQLLASQDRTSRGCWDEQESIFSDMAWVSITRHCFLLVESTAIFLKSGPFPNTSRSFSLGEGLGVTRRLRPRSPLHPTAAPKPPGWQDGDERAIWGQLCGIPGPRVGRKVLLSTTRPGQAEPLCPKQIN